MRKWIIWILCGVIAIILAVLLLLPEQSAFDKLFGAEIRDTTTKVRAGHADLTLAILTDLHYDPAKYKDGEADVLQPTMDCIARLFKEVRIDALWNLGDFINGHDTTKAEAAEQIRTVTEAQKKVTIDYHNIEGNHDNNIQATWGQSGLPEEEILSNAELNELLRNTETEQTEVHSAARPTDYYVDINGIRVICLTAEYATWMPETADWLASDALQCDLPVLILSHIPTRPEWGFKGDVENGRIIEDALKAFIASGGTVIAFIHGHDHGDMIRQVKDGDRVLWHSVAIGCARFQKPTSNGTEGMTFRDRNEADETEVLFDIVSVDLENREVRFTRFGAGEDRVIDF